MSLSVEVLGPLRVVTDGRPLELGPARRRALLAALVVDAGRVVSVDTVADRVWDGHPPDGAVATVQAYMSRLRASLRPTPGTVGARPGEEGPLRTRPPGYLLELPANAVDALRFQELLARGRDRSTAGDHEAASVVLRSALGLWRGEPYLDISAQFARREAERLEELRLSALELAARCDLELGRSAEVVDELRAAVREHPLREGLHASLVVALYREGRQADALQQIDAVRELLAEELGIDPSPELRRLQQQVLTQDPALAATARRGVRAAEHPSDRTPDSADVGALPRPETATRPRVPLRGRTAELERLIDVVGRAEAGEPAVIAVVGEAGIGKTRLVEEVVAAASDRGAAVAWGHCWQHQGAPVLWPWTEALSQLATQAGPEAVQGLLHGRAAGAAALLDSPGEAPAGTARTDTDHPPESLDTVRVRLYDAVAALLQALSEDRLVVVVLEDGHWADPATRELLEYLATTVRTARLAVIVTVRGGTEDASRSGPELLGALSRSGRAGRVELRGLAAQHVRDCVVDRTGSLLDDATTSALTERTGGNPFFVGELVRLLVTDVEGGTDSVLPDTVPDTVREVVLRRVRQMPEPDQVVLTTAAVVGRSFDPNLLETACGLGADAVDEALDRATAAGVVRTDPDAPDRHQFVHALTQQAVLETTGPARVRRLHARIARALEGRGEPTTPAQVERLTVHLAGSGGSADLARAVELHVRAADTAWAVGLHAETESLLLRALDFAARLDGDEADRREMAVRLHLWSLYTMTDGPGTDSARGHHARAVELVRRYGGSVEVMAVHQAVLADASWNGHLARMEALAQEMAAAAEAADDELMRLAAWLALGLHRVYTGRLREALACLEAAASHPAALSDVPVGIFPLDPAANLPLWHAVTLVLLGQDTAAREQLAAVEVALADASLTTSAYVPTMLALVHALQDDPAAALARASEGAAVARRYGFAEALLFVDVLLAWAQERCAPGSALSAARSALDASLQRPGMALRPLLRGLVADVHLRAGDAAAALAQVEAGLAGAASNGDVVYSAECHRLRALCWHAMGRPREEVLAEAETALTTARAQGAAVFAARAERLVAELRLGRTEGATGRASAAHVERKDGAGPHRHGGGTGDDRSPAARRERP